MARWLVSGIAGAPAQVAEAADHVLGLGHLQHAAAHVVVGTLDGPADSGSGRLKASSRFGSTSTWYCLTKPPTLATSETPSTAVSS